MEVTVSDILSWTGGRVVNENDFGESLDKVRVSKPTPLEVSEKDCVSFFFSKEYQHELVKARPGVLITGETIVDPLSKAGLPVWTNSVVVACSDPYRAMAVISGKLAPGFSSVVHPVSSNTEIEVDVHSTAVVASSAKISNGVKIGPHCVIQDQVEVGENTVLYPGCFVGEGVKIGRDCVLFPRVSIYEKTKIGSRVRLHSGVVLGADGFGYAPNIREGRPVGHQKIFHIGGVSIGNDVEVGANSCIDRGTFSDTMIEDHVKIDNQVQIGHNAQVGEGTILCGCVAVAGGIQIGKYVYVGGVTGIANKVKIGDGAKVGACSLITKDIPSGGTGVGNPQRTHRDHFRLQARLNRKLREKN